MLILLATVVTSWFEKHGGKEDVGYTLYRYSLEREQGKILYAAALLLPFLAAALTTCRRVSKHILLVMEWQQWPGKSIIAAYLIPGKIQWHTLMESSSHQPPHHQKWCKRSLQ